MHYTRFTGIVAAVNTLRATTSNLLHVVGTIVPTADLSLTHQGYEAAEARLDTALAEVERVDAAIENSPLWKEAQEVRRTTAALVELQMVRIDPEDCEAGAGAYFCVREPWERAVEALARVPLAALGTCPLTCAQALVAAVQDFAGQCAVVRASLKDLIAASPGKMADREYMDKRAHYEAARNGLELILGQFSASLTAEHPTSLAALQDLAACAKVENDGSAAARPTGSIDLAQLEEFEPYTEEGYRQELAACLARLQQQLSTAGTLTTAGGDLQATLDASQLLLKQARTSAHRTAQAGALERVQRHLTGEQTGS